MHVEIAYLRWRGKRSRHSRRLLTHNFAYLARGPWASCLDSELASPWPSHHVVPEKQSCHVVCGAWQGPGHTEIFLPKTPVAQGSIFSSDVALEFEGSTQHYHFTPLTWWMTPPTVTKGQRLPSVGWMHAFINLSPCLRCTWARPSLRNNVKRDSSLKTQCHQCISSHLMCVLLGLWSDSFDLHASADVADECLNCVEKFCWRILATHPTFLPTLTGNSSQSTFL